MCVLCRHEECIQLIICSQLDILVAWPRRLLISAYMHQLNALRLHDVFTHTHTHTHTHKQTEFQNMDDNDTYKLLCTEKQYHVRLLHKHIVMNICTSCSVYS